MQILGAVLAFGVIKLLYPDAAGLAEHLTRPGGTSDPIPAPREHA